MISFLGEQPIPNLLPIRYYRPEQVLLVYTEHTELVGRRLQPLIGADVVLCKTDPYEIRRIDGDVEQAVAGAGWEGGSLVFNLTGGTKPMVLAGYRLAEKHRSRFLYLQTEGRESKVYRYRFGAEGPALEGSDILPGVITIGDYLRAHLDGYTITGASKGEGGAFEEAVAQALEGMLDEKILGVKCGGALDIDLVLRCGNRVGIAEVKTGKKARSKGGIDQLATAGGREFLGTYTSKLLIVDTEWDSSISHLRELASARDIVLVELPGYQGGVQLGEADKQTLIEKVSQVLPCSGGQA